MHGYIQFIPIMSLPHSAVEESFLEDGRPKDKWSIPFMPTTQLQWTAFILHTLLIKIFLIVTIIGVQSLSIGIFFHLPTQTASTWVSTILMISSNLLSTIICLAIVLVMQRLYLEPQGSIAENIRSSVVRHLLTMLYLTCLVLHNVLAPLIFTLELMPTPLFNKIHLNKVPYSLGFATAILMFLLGFPLFFSANRKVQMIMLH